MNILFLKGFNNYFNRTVKKYSDLADYKGDCSSYVDYPSINFNPNDGIVTELVIGSENQKENSLPLAWEDNGTPDYCVCYEMQENTPVIKSRWYVLESERIRLGQYRLALKRDVLAEHFDSIMTAPCFVEKGFVNDVNSTLLYNRESMTYNQIKQREIPLVDETGCGWIVGYVSQDAQNYPANTGDAQPNWYKSVGKVAGTNPSDTIDYDDLPENIKSILNTTFYFDDKLSLSSPSGLQPFYSNENRNSGIQVEFESRLNAPTLPLTNRQGHFKYYDVNLESYENYIPRPEPHSTFVISTATGQCQQSVVQSGYTMGRIFDFNPSTNFPQDEIFPSTANYPAPFYTSSGGTTPWYFINGITNLLVRVNYAGFKVDYFNTFNKTYINCLKIRELAQQFYNYKYVDVEGRLYKLVIEEAIVDAPENEYYDIQSNELLFLDSLGQKTKTIRDLIAEYVTSGTDNVLSYNGLRQVTRDIANNKVINPTDPMVDGDPIIRWRYAKYKRGSIKLVPVEDTDVCARMDASRQPCNDACYDVFCIPYSDNFTFEKNGTSITMNKAIALQAAVALGQAGLNVYDIQLLPYFPDRSAVGITESGKELGLIHDNYVDLDLFTEHVDYEYITNSDNFFDPERANIGVIFWSRVSNGELNIENPITLENSDEPIVRKISNETDVYRVVSPNYSGQFEFSVAKSGGLINLFNIDYTYKPYNPYLHVTPGLTGLYGDNFVSLDDARGLICGGDFSLSRVTSGWEQYQLQNKNFQEMFDRQIKNMDVNNAIAREQQQLSGILGIATGGIGGAVGGAMAGSKVPGLGTAAGAIGGAVMGTVGGAIGYVKDKEWLERQQQEARSYAIDMYGYQLGNIQAMPYALTKTSAFTKNNRVFPFVEYYTSTYEETELLRNKIEYNGMTVMAADKLEDFSTSPFEKTFLKGQLIRLEEITDDFHIADAIYQEVNKGFYIKQGE